MKLAASVIGVRVSRFTVLVVLLAFFSQASFGYIVGSAVSLEKLTAEADFIFKGTVISSDPTEDVWFKPIQGFVAKETQFKIVSVIKGDAGGDTIRFHHYGEGPLPFSETYRPQLYRFVVGRTYIVFAKKSEVDGVFRQLWQSHTAKADQGVLLCSDGEPVIATSVKDVIWHEFVNGLRSARASDVLYTIGQLDQMSSGGYRFDSTQDFARQDVQAVVHDLMTNANSQIRDSAITIIGSHNPYLSDSRAESWLVTVGSAQFPGYTKMDSKMKNGGGETYWQELVAIADQNETASTRAVAIRALGLVREPALEKSIARWTGDAEPEVRASATVLLADFPGTNSKLQLKQLATDSEAKVRTSVARSIGFSQQSQLSDVLAKLLKDDDSEVRKAAAMSLLSFSPRIETVSQVLRTNLDNREFHPLFLNALAVESPEAYLDRLAKAVEENAEPTNWWGGKLPAFAAWEILFKYLQGRPTDVVQSGKLDRYLDAMEHVGNYSSSEPRDIYAFYLQRGMTERAQKYREAAKKRLSYDIDYYFKQVEANPSSYTRQ